MPKFEVVSEYTPSGGFPPKALLLRGPLDLTQMDRQSPSISRFWRAPKRLCAALAAAGRRPAAGRR